jgi:UDP-N-acetylmuramate dehydrogenase
LTPPSATTTAERSVGAGLAEYTTLRVGGPAGRMVVAHSEDEVVALVGELDAAGEPVLVLGGGSNVLIGDGGFNGTVVRIATRGIEADESGCTGAIVAVAAGEDWDSLVARAIAREWSGIEALSGIPGLVGASPIQNVGAYGCELSQTVARVRTYDRRTRRRATFSMAECGFDYRTSRFKAEPGRYLILSVTFQFRLGTRAAPIRYAELARALGVDLGDRPPAADVRAAVLDLRRGKGMVLDVHDHDTWSAGSFFTNPILDPTSADRLPSDAPRWPQPDGRVKTSAAWLIEHAGFAKGHGAGAARLSTKHTLALTNRGAAGAEDLLALAREVRDGVATTYGIILQPEPVLVGCEL